MRQAAQYNLRNFTRASCLLLPVPQSLLKLRFRKRGEVTNPFPEKRFLRTAFFNAFTTAMFNAVGRLRDQNGEDRILPVHEFDQRFAEGVDAVFGSTLLGESETGRRGYAFGIMARTATGLLQNRI